jgi:hypothetical protein
MTPPLVPMPAWVGRIGFVLHNRSPAGPRGPGYPRPFPGARAKLGSFCTFPSPAEPRPARGLPLPTCPTSPKFGFVLHNSLRQPPRPAVNWVRFAHSPCHRLSVGVTCRAADRRPYCGACAAHPYADGSPALKSTCCLPSAIRCSIVTIASVFCFYNKR